MPGNRMSELQVTKYKELRGKHTQEAAAAKTGVSVASAHRIESAVLLPSQKPPRSWRKRADPLDDVCTTEVVPMLESAPGLMAVAVLKELQLRYPRRFDGECCARCNVGLVSGVPSMEVIARSSSPRSIRPADWACRTSRCATGRALASPASPCRTCCTSSPLRTAAGAMPVSCWAASQALASGLQAALWMAGGVPEEHGTDSLSAVFSNLAE